MIELRFDATKHDVAAGVSPLHLLVFGRMIELTFDAANRINARSSERQFAPLLLIF
jgi:hypothetical protein